MNVFNIFDIDKTFSSGKQDKSTNLDKTKNVLCCFKILKECFQLSLALSTYLQFKYSPSNLKLEKCQLFIRIICSVQASPLFKYIICSIGINHCRIHFNFQNLTIIIDQIIELAHTNRFYLIVL